jgi:cobalt-zinc-cadmium efflux system outer membrane protein
MSIQRFLLIVAAVTSISAPLAHAQEQSGPLGTPGMPHFIHSSGGASNRPAASLASTENLEITTPLPGLPTTYKIRFREFMKYLQESNINLAAQRFNIPIAQAQLTAARVYPDPTFESGYGGDLSNERQPSNYTGGLSQTILLGGKIGARTAAANDALQVSRAQLADYLRNLRTQAANTFIDGLTGFLILQRKSKALMRANELVEVNEKRLKKNEIREDEVLRTRIAALEAQSDLISTESSLHETLASMSVLLGSQQRDGLLSPVGNLDIPPRNFSLEDLVERAVTSRSDVVAASNALDTARAQYRLAQVNRIPDLTLSGAYAHITRATNPIDPSPAWDSAGLTLSIPLPFSDLNKGNLEAANYAQLQAGVALQAAKLQAQADVRIAYERYTLAVDAVKQFESEVLHDADGLYQSRLFRMEEGKSSLVDVLNAHQAINQIYIDYYNALSEQAKALVALESSAGVWDIDF